LAQQLQMQLLQQCVVRWWTRLAIRALFLALLTAASTGVVGALEAPGHHHDQDEMQQGGLPQQKLLPQAEQARSQTVVLPLSRGPLRVVPGRASQQFWSEAETGRWEPETFKVLYQELTSDVSYLGVGEWCGITGLFAAQRSKRAILVEPDPVALDELRTNVDIFNAESRVGGARRVSIETRCVSAPQQQGTVTMVGNGSSTSSLVHGLSWLQGAPTFEATCMTLEDLITHHGLSGEVFIKMDIEGAEATVVPSLLSWLSRLTMKPKIFISFHAQATQAQKEEIAKVFNLYKHYAVLKVLPPRPPFFLCMSPQLFGMGYSMGVWR
jgi:FkbM family methyltransferase